MTSSKPRIALARPESTVVLCGPAPEPGTAGYGAGKGGYVRNVAVLLRHFAEGDIRMTLSPYSTRRYSRWWALRLPFRLIADLWVFARNIRCGGAVHVMMTYGLAIYREFGMSVIAAVSSRPLILDIRGGSFVPWLNSTGWLQRAMADWVLAHANAILGQGLAVVAYLRPRYGNKVYHFPNFVQSEHLPAHVQTKCAQPQLAVIFVGYCYDGKGVFDLVEGCARAARRGLAVRVTLVGAESPEFARYLDGYAPPPGLVIERCGTRGFEEVQTLLTSHDVFCFPTRHPGEGHPNAITEAMAHALVIVTTRHGFIAELLDDSAAYFIEQGAPDGLADVLVHVDRHRDEARSKAHAAREVVRERFTEALILGQLRELYRRALRRP